MISSKADLVAALEAGATVALMAPFEGDGPMLWAIAHTGQAVDGYAMRRLRESGQIRVIHADLFGEAYQFGASA